MKRIFLVGVFIALIPLLVYLYCLSPGISWEDSGEFITTASSLGIAHPPGHPLYVILCHLFTIGSASQGIARSVNLFSVACAFLTLIAFTTLLSLISPSRLKEKQPVLVFLGLFAITLTFAFSDTFWSVTETAEVYTLHALLAVCLFVSLVLFSQRGGRHILLFFYLLGMSLTNNVTIAYLIPAFICFLVMERKRIEKRFLFPSFLLFLLGISLYGYIPLRAQFDPVFNWGNASTVRNFIHLLTAREFSKGFFSMTYAETSPLSSLLQLLKEISFWGILPLVYGIVVLFRKHRNIAILFSAAALCNTGLSMLTGRGPDLHAYFLPSIILCMLAIGYGIMHVLNTLKMKAWLFCGFLVVLVSVPILMNYRSNCRRNDSDARNYGTALLEWLSEDAVLVTENTNDYFILTYLVEVESLKEVDIFYAPLFRERWYQEKLSSSGFRWRHELTPLSLAAECEREIFYTPGAGISLPVRSLVPYGPLFRIVMHGEGIRKTDFKLPDPTREQGKKRYAYLYARFGEFYFEERNYASAVTAFELAKKYDPANAAIYHNLSLLYRKLKDLEKAALYEEAAKERGFNE